jgi:hypothetical protein
MNWQEFVFIFSGPSSLWFVGIAIVFLGVVLVITAKRNIAAQREFGAQLLKGIGELKESTHKLNEELVDLNEDVTKLNDEMKETRKSSDLFRKTLDDIYYWWRPNRK